LTRVDKFTGSTLVICAMLMVFRAMCQDVIDHPTRWGLAGLVADLIVGTLIVHSVWRDRL
jgi:hypothetical protein